MPQTVTVRPVVAGDAEAWAGLFAGYRDFYRLEPDGDVVARVWGWVLRGEHGVRGLVAVDDDDRLVGLANVRAFARPSRGTTGLYLDDLFTGPEHRGRGVAAALLRAAADLAAAEGHDVVRWITDTDNATARSVYDAHATATRWVTYDMGRYLG